ncbi:MAG: hypothetical protein GWO02_15040, partial [Gammaproteobacteria bacterium]|nr:hypothetical protein [Gammaproteobacteria bacterium]
MIRRIGIRAGAAVAALLLLPLGGCDRLRRPELKVPTDDEAAAFFDAHEGIERVDVDGTVVEVLVRQPDDQLRRG